MILGLWPVLWSHSGEAQTSAARPIIIVAFGDSLTAGFGLQPHDSFPARLEKVLRARGHAVAVQNAGVSGDTTSAGLDRLAWAVPPDADAVIVALGANDMLRGGDVARARANLDQILTTIARQRQQILVAGMRAALNMPADYRAAFDTIFPDLAAKHGALLYPFFLDGVALEPRLNLADGIHPTAAGIAIIVDRMLPKVEELIARIKAAPRS